MTGTYRRRSTLTLTPRPSPHRRAFPRRQRPDRHRSHIVAGRCRTSTIRTSEHHRSMVAAHTRRAGWRLRPARSPRTGPCGLPIAFRLGLVSSSQSVRCMIFLAVADHQAAEKVTDSSPPGPHTTLRPPGPATVQASKLLSGMASNRAPPTNSIRRPPESSARASDRPHRTVARQLERRRHGPVRSPDPGRRSAR